MQVEITSRLLGSLRAIGRHTVVANCRNAIAGFEGDQIWSRVCCQSPLHYKWTDGKLCCCRPDILMCDEFDPNNPPDARGEDCPVLWACEIKYRPPAMRSGWDQKKLRLVVQEGKIKYGGWLNMNRARKHRRRSRLDVRRGRRAHLDLRREIACVTLSPNRIVRQKAGPTRTHRTTSLKCTPKYYGQRTIASVPRQKVRCKKPMVNSQEPIHPPFYLPLPRLNRTGMLAERHYRH